MLQSRGKAAKPQCHHPLTSTGGSSGESGGGAGDARKPALTERLGGARTEPLSNHSGAEPVNTSSSTGRIEACGCSLCVCVLQVHQVESKTQFHSVCMGQFSRRWLSHRGSALISGMSILTKG